MNEDTNTSATAPNAGRPRGAATSRALQGQIEALQAQVNELLRQREEAVQGPSHRPVPRVLSSLAKFQGKRGEDVRQWLFKVEQVCAIHQYDVDEDNVLMPPIAGTAMEGSAAGWFLHWSASTPNEDQTWGSFSAAARQHFEASNYQKSLRKKLRELKQTLVNLTAR